jgi:hypothetical protein
MLVFVRRGRICDVLGYELEGWLGRGTNDWAASLATRSDKEARSPWRMDPSDMTDLESDIGVVREGWVLWVGD